VTAAPPLLLALALAGAPAAAPPPPGPAETLKAADRALRGALAAGQDGARLGDAVAPFLDYEELARRSLGKRWAAQRPADRAALVQALRALLEATYLTGLRFDPKATFAVATTRRTGEVAEVKGSAASDGEVVPLELRLRRGADGRWRIFDATVAGLAIVEGYQEQFPQLLDLGGMPRLLRQLEAETRAKLGAPAPTAATSGATTATPRK
jgi:phospholipid transport system substrate-binding protein